MSDETGAELLQKASEMLSRHAEEAEALSQVIYEFQVNQYLAQFGLHVGDRLFFTDEYRALTGLDKVPGWMNYLDEVVELVNLRVDENGICYLSTEGGGEPNIPLEVILRMKAAAVERDQRYEALSAELDAAGRGGSFEAGMSIKSTDWLYVNSEDRKVYSYKAGMGSAYLGSATRDIQKGDPIIIPARRNQDSE